MNVAIVILIWNGKRDTLECLASLRADIYPHKQIIVVDNGSADGSADEIRMAFPEVTVLQNKTNLGFCAGNNIGIEYALNRGFAYVYLLNNDTTVEPNALTHLMRVAEANPRFGIVAPVMHDYKGTRTIWFAGSQVNLRRGEAVHDNSRQPVRTDVPYTVPWVTGCALIARADLLRKLGGLDERYFLSWEDVDLGLRTTKAGWQLAVVPAARIYHKGGQSSGRLLGNSRDYYDVRNRLLLLQTHCESGYHRAALYVIARNIARPFREPARRISERFRDLRRILAGVRDHLLGRYGEAGSRRSRENNVPNRPAPCRVA